MATILSNLPPPNVLFAEHADDLFNEAKNWLDGEPIANEEQAEAVASLLNRLRRVAKDADEARRNEKKPHDDAAKAVQAKWTPIISKCDLAASTAKQALAPWLKAIEDKQRAEAEAARQEAERLAEVARQAHSEAGADLSKADDAERLLKAAKAAEKDAARAHKAKPLATGGERAIGLRSSWSATLTDPVAALKHYRDTRPEELKQWLAEQAERDVRAGARTIPGFDVTENRIAV